MHFWQNHKFIGHELHICDLIPSSLWFYLGQLSISPLSMRCFFPRRKWRSCNRLWHKRTLKETQSLKVTHQVLSLITITNLY